MLIISGVLSFKVSFSVGHENGGSIFRVIVVANGPEFWMVNGFEIGLDATPFSQVYTKFSFYSLGTIEGMMKLPMTFEKMTCFGFLSPWIVVEHTHSSLDSPTWLELALN